MRSIGHIEAADDEAASGSFKSGPLLGLGFDFPNNMELNGELITINIGDQVVHMLEKMDHLDDEQEAYLVIQDQQVVIIHICGDNIEDVGIYRKLH